MMNQDDFNTGLLAYLDASPTPFHAVANACSYLKSAGFTGLNEGAVWEVAPGGRYFVIRNDSSIVAFVAGTEPPAEAGVRLIGAHTDSPNLRLKPNPFKKAHGYLQFAVEVYGGALLNPWFDRDLSIAGRVTLRQTDGVLSHRLINVGRPVATIPSLAIHLDREANNGRPINAQTMLPPVVSLAVDREAEGEASGGETAPLGRQFRQILTAWLGRDEASGAPFAPEQLLDFELSLYDTQAARLVGLNASFIASARIDNLLSCYVGLQALLAQADTAHRFTRMLVLNDHEEVGSGSTSGARGNFLETVLERLSGSSEAYGRMAARSFLLSTDNGHAIHPNFSDRHEPGHAPLINAGPALKVNSNQAYASSGETLAIARELAHRVDVPLQVFVTRSDMGCGSTIGPLTATRLGLRTVDVGVPTFAMHSIRELAGCNDAHQLYRLGLGLYAIPDIGVVPAC